MNLAVVGSRDFNDYSLIEREINNMIDFIKLRHKVKKINIISGGAKGADSLAREFYYNNNDSDDIDELIEYFADWKKYGKKAGYIRNDDIIKNSDIIIAFWDGISKGTKHSIDLSKKSKKPIKIIKYKEI